MSLLNNFPHYLDSFELYEIEHKADDPKNATRCLLDCLCELVFQSARNSDSESCKKYEKAIESVQELIFAETERDPRTEEGYPDIQRDINECIENTRKILTKLMENKL